MHGCNEIAAACSYIKVLYILSADAVLLKTVNKELSLWNIDHVHAAVVILLILHGVILRIIILNIYLGGKIIRILVRRVKMAAPSAHDIVDIMGFNSAPEDSLLVP